MGTGDSGAGEASSTLRAATVDLNADVGESFGAWSMGDDAALLTVVTSANVACGFHAGDATTARVTCATAAAAGVAVGAHVGYRDLAGFGRRFLDVEPERLRDEVTYQIGALQALARVQGTAVRHVKPHGALYNAVVHHEAQAAAVLAAVQDVDPGLLLYVLPGSQVEALARDAGLRTVAEAFADRGYLADGTLAPRGTHGAVLHDPRTVADRAVRMVVEGLVDATPVPGAPAAAVAVRPGSLCVHGDTPGAVTIARAVRAALEAAGVALVRAGTEPDGTEPDGTGRDGTGRDGTGA